MKLLVAEEFLDGLQFGFGHVEIFLCAFRVLLLHIQPRFGEIEVHALFRSNDVSAQTVAGRGLLAFQIVEALRNRGGPAFHVRGLLLHFFGERRVLRRNRVRRRRLRRILARRSR